MEKWQKEHLWRNFSTLVENSKCTPQFLSEVASFLNGNDNAELAEKLRLKGEQQQARILFRIAQKTEGIFAVLTKAFFDTNQVKAFQLLLEGFLEQGIKNVFEICKINEQEERLLEALKGFEKDGIVTFREEMTLVKMDGVVDFDEGTGYDPFQVGLYATDIFEYYKRRELQFPIKKYLEKQVELDKNMRSILVDWMVEVQESFEMNNETLYLAVKLVDLFLGRTLVKRNKLQLVATTALYIAAKYDERSPPVIDDLCYICDNAYSQKDVIQMEDQLLKTLKFDIGMPLSYRFLRRYAQVTELDMETLTFARFILEMSLMEYDFIDGLDSMMAASALLLALKILKVDNAWTPTLKYYSTYSTEDLFDMTHRLYDYLRKPQPHLITIRSKYSHKVFYEVAKIPMPDELKL